MAGADELAGAGDLARACDTAGAGSMTVAGAGDLAVAGAGDLAQAGAGETPGAGPLAVWEDLAIAGHSGAGDLENLRPSAGEAEGRRGLLAGRLPGVPFDARGLHSDGSSLPMHADWR